MRDVDVRVGGGLVRIIQQRLRARGCPKVNL
jgi:hypothetical protein